MLQQREGTATDSTRLHLHHALSLDHQQQQQQQVTLMPAAVCVVATLYVTHRHHVQLSSLRWRVSRRFLSVSEP